MKKLLVIIIAMSLFRSYAQDSHHNDEYFVINILGAEIYERPTFQSKQIRKIEVGESLIAQEIISTTEVKKIGANFILKGSWIRTNIAGTSAYVFSSDLTKIKPMINIGNSGEKSINLFGKKKSERKLVKKKKCGNSYCEYRVNTTDYDICRYTCTMWDDCYNHTYTFKGLTLSEAYHQMLNIYHDCGSNKEMQTPIFTNRRNNVYNFSFEETPTEDLKITIKRDGIIEVSSYDCT